MANRTVRGTRVYATAPRAAASARRNGLRDVARKGTVVYAIRQNNGLVKIGVTANLLRRSEEIGTEVLGFFFGDYDDEQAIHASLVPHRAHGREYYHPTSEVLAVVNDMRSDLGLPRLAA